MVCGAGHVRVNDKRREKYRHIRLRVAALPPSLPPSGPAVDCWPDGMMMACTRQTYAMWEVSVSVCTVLRVRVKPSPHPTLCVYAMYSGWLVE